MDLTRGDSGEMPVFFLERSGGRTKNEMEKKRKRKEAAARPKTLTGKKKKKKLRTGQKAPHVLELVVVAHLEDLEQLGVRVRRDWG